MNEIIPKKLHYCWFGGNKHDQRLKECLESWKSYLPEYEIIEWNETNFDVNINSYVKKAYEAKKYAFVSDYVRLFSLYNHGGIYVDTDLEILKSLNSFLNNEAFFGFESNDMVSTAIIGSRVGHPLIYELMKDYDKRSFLLNDGTLDLTTNVFVISNKLKTLGLKTDGKQQMINGVKIYPQYYFSPNSIEMIFDIKPKKSYTIHHFSSSWSKNHKNSKVKRFLVGRLRNTIGYDNLIKFKNFLKL